MEPQSNAVLQHQVVQSLPVSLIFTSPHQMRKHFDLTALQELAGSMRQEGLIQPITVRRVGNSFELVAGERRWRAAQLLGWKTIDARIIEISDEDAAVKGLIENLQRANLSPIEEARGYKQLLERPYGLTPEAVALRVGKTPSTIARALTLLELPLDIQSLLMRGKLTESHTRSIRKLPKVAQQIALARQADRQGWTVKETERRVAILLNELGEPIQRREGKKKSSGGDDPLAHAWKAILGEAETAQVRMSHVRYEGMGTWALRIEAKMGPQAHETLGDFFIRLGQGLNRPLPPDLRKKDPKRLP